MASKELCRQIARQASAAVEQKWLNSQSSTITASPDPQAVVASSGEVAQDTKREKESKRTGIADFDEVFTAVAGPPIPHPRSRRRAVTQVDEKGASGGNNEEKEKERPAAPAPVAAKRRNLPSVNAMNVTRAKSMPDDPTVSVRVNKVSLSGTTGLSTEDLGVLAVRVDGFNAHTSEDNVRQFFASLPLTGVVCCKVEVVYNQQQRTAVVCYDTPQLAAAVSRRSDLVLDGASLAVRLLPARPPPPPRRGNNEFDLRTLLFKSLTPLVGEIDSVRLREFAAEAGKAAVERVDFMPRPGTALVHYVEAPDYEHALRVVSTRPLQGSMVSVQRVPLPVSMQVHCIASGISQDQLRDYFESNAESGGGEVESIRMFEDQHCAIVKFKEKEPIPAILARQHVIAGRPLMVSPYVDCLGIIPPDFDTSRPSQAATPVMIFDCDPEIVSYICQNDEIRQRIESQMATLHCLVTWPEYGSGSVRLSSSVPSRGGAVGEAGALGAGRAERCGKALRIELDRYKAAEVKIPYRIWKDVAPIIDSGKSTMAEQPLLRADKLKRTVTLFGRRTVVDDQLKRIQRISAVADSGLTISNGLCMETLPMETYELNIIQRVWQPMEGVDIQFNDKGLSLTAGNDALEAVKVKIASLRSNIETVHIEGRSSLYCSLVMTPAVMGQIEKCLVQEDLIASFSVDASAGSISTYAMTRLDAGKAAKIIDGEVLEKSIKLDESKARCTIGPEWKCFVADLRLEFELFYVVEDGKEFVTVGAAKREFERIAMRVANFINENEIQESFVPMTEGVVDLLEMYGRKKTEAIASELMKYKIELIWIHRQEGKPGCCIRGVVAGLALASGKLEDLARNVQSKEHAVDPHMTRFMLKDQTMTMVSGIASKRSMVIRYPDESDVEGAADGRNEKGTKIAPFPLNATDGERVEAADCNEHPKEEPLWVSGPTINSMLTREGIKIELIPGSIATFEVDVILCPGDRDLDLSKGVVTQSLLAVAGPGLQAELRTNYPQGLSEGQVGKTSGYGLHCKSVYHAKVLHWNSGTAEANEQILRSILRESLRLASAENMTSIAWPTVGCGKLNYPKNVVAAAMFDEVRRFSAANQKSSLRDVRIAIFEQDQLTTNVFAEEFVAQRLAAVNVDERDKDWLSGDTASTLKTKEGLSLRLAKGSIEEELADVILCASGKDLDLSKGAVSRSLLAAAGPSLQTELNNNYPQGLPQSLVGNTKGYKLRCGNVYHATLTQWDSGAAEACEKRLRSVLRESLNLASKEQKRIIAWPTIGCGNLNYPRNLVAAAMFDEVQRFSSANQSSSLRYVSIIIYEQDLQTLDAFVAQFQSAKSAEVRRSAATKRSVVLRKQKGDTMPPDDCCQTIRDDSSKPAADEAAGAARCKINSLHPLVLSLYAFSASDIEAALAEIKNLNQEFVIGGSSRANIDGLDYVQELEISSLQQKYAIAITINKAVGEIRLNGDPERMPEAVADIYDIISEHRTSSEEVQWENLSGDGKYYAYGTEIGALIERAYQDKQPTVELKKNGIVVMRINLEDMTQEIIERPSSKTKVIRRVISEGSFHLPSSWAVMTTDVAFISVELSPTDAEFQDVIALLNQPGRDIIKVERIQNPSLYWQYAQRRKIMDMMNGAADNERRLWHGTACGSITNINKGGFNRNYCGKHGVKFGNGVYFATNSDYPIEKGFCPSESQRLRHIYLARVLTGKFTKGAEGLREPPEIPEKPDAAYNSVVDNVDNPSMFVVFYDTQTYPEYLITFK